MAERLIDDGFGGYLIKCLRPDCSLQIVRPGSSQCNSQLEINEDGEEVWIDPCVWEME